MIRNTLTVLALATSAIAATTQAAELRTHSGKSEILRAVAFIDNVDEELGLEDGFVDYELHDELIEQASCCSDCAAQVGGKGKGKGHIATCGRWAKFDYLLWWRSGRNLPPLVTGAPGPMPSPVLFGNDTIGEEARPGGRIEIGFLLDDWGAHGISADFLMLADQTTRFNQDTGTGALFRPFVGPVVPGPDVQQAQPILADVKVGAVFGPGFVNIQSKSSVHTGNLLYNWMAGPNARTIVGYQFARVDEDLLIRDNTTLDPIPGVNIAGFDQISTRNDFHGVTFGVERQLTYGSWQVGMLSKLGLGNMRQRLRTNGATVTQPSDGSGVGLTTDPFGLLVGVQSLEADEFALASQLGLTLTHSLGDAIDVSIGYSYLYLSSVAQPGEQIPTGALGVPSSNAGVLPAPPPTPPTPITRIRDSSFTLHGINAGATFRF